MPHSLDHNSNKLFKSIKKSIFPTSPWATYRYIIAGYFDHEYHEWIIQSDISTSFIL